MTYVLDATAIRSGMTIAGEGWFTTTSVINEIRLGRQGKGLDLLLETTIKVMEPDENFKEEVKKAAISTGDIESLSKTDIDVLALAHQLKATLISDDYAVQNIASILKIIYKTDLAGIREIIHWTYRCRGCGKYFEENQIDCPVCGSEVRKVKNKSHGK